jgi:hypothetical protein
MTVAPLRRPARQPRARGAASRSTRLRAAQPPSRSEGRELLAKRRQFGAVDAEAEHAAVERADQRGGGVAGDDAAGHQDRHARAQIGDVVDDVRRQDHDAALADLGQQVVEAVALLGVQPGSGFVDDDQLRVPDQCLGDAEALAHAAGESRDRTLAHVPQVHLLQQRLHRLAPLTSGGDPLEHGQVIEHRQCRHARIDAEILRQVAQ